MRTPTLGTLELATLLAVARLGDDAYGLAVRHDLAVRTGRDYSVGAVYTTLQRLEDKAFLRSYASEPLGGRSATELAPRDSGMSAKRCARRRTWCAAPSLAFLSQTSASLATAGEV